MTLDRRTLLTSAAAAGAALAAGPAAARVAKEPPPGAMGMLYDTTLCIGCKTCVVACHEANDLKPDTRLSKGLWDMPVDLSGGTKNVIKLYKEADSPRRSYFKAQCMHCVDPACTSACMLGSLKKDPKTGVVGYSPEYCVGCRYCSMACPYEICRFQFDEAAPKVVKCELCRHRVKDEAKKTASGYTRYPAGQGPACAEVCPRGAVIYGRRDELLAEAKRRIAEHPERYVGYAEADPARVFGETDGGGTQVLYLAHVPFEKLGLPDLGTEPVPHTANVVQEGIYRGFVAPVALYAVLAGVLLRNRKAGESGAGKGGTP